MNLMHVITGITEPNTHLLVVSLHSLHIFFFNMWRAKINSSHLLYMVIQLYNSRLLNPALLNSTFRYGSRLLITRKRVVLLAAQPEINKNLSY